MHLHCLHIGVLPVSMHAIDLMMNTQYSGLDFNYKTCFHRPYLHACANLVKQPENLFTSFLTVFHNLPLPHSIPLHRGKIQELNMEILKMTREIEVYSQDSATYLAFEKR